MLSFLRLAISYCFRSSSGVPLTTWLSVLGMSVAVACLVVAMAVMGGFKRTLQSTVIDISGHLVVAPNSPDLSEEMLERVRPLLNGFEAASPFLFLEAVLAHRGQVAGVGIEGVDLENWQKVMRLQDRLLSGSLGFATRDGGSSGVVIGRGIAERFGLTVGDTFRLVVPISSQARPGDFRPKLGQFVVAGIVGFGHHKFDTRYILMSLEQAQKFAGVPEQLTGYKIRLDDDEEALAASLAILNQFGGDYYVKDWKAGNRNLFEAVDLEKAIIFLILLIIVIVACFNISGTLFISVVRRFKDISILKAMGASGYLVMFLFSLQGLTLGALGCVLGWGLGVGVCELLNLYQKRFGLIRGEVYQLDYIELSYSAFDFVLIFSVSLFLCFVATLAPARRGARLSPVEGLRYE